MARLASQAKAGFYPTPDSVTNLLIPKFEIADGARLLDPCCGEGRTLYRFGSAGITYGIELDHGRVQEARGKLSKVIWGDALTEVRISPGSFDLLFLNPPYDNALAAESTKVKRLEEQFLRRYLSVLKTGGHLVFVIPYYVLKHCAKPLSRYFSDVQVFVFPKEDFLAFKQCVVIGRKRVMAPKEEAQVIQKQLETYAALDPYVFMATASPLQEVPIMKILAADGPLKTFVSTKTDPLEAIPAFQKTEVLNGLLKELAPKDNHHIRPLNPLKNGHMLLMLAGGYMNGNVPKKGQELVIKGIVTKSEEVIKTYDDGSGGGSITTRDKYQPTVKVIDLQKAELFIVR